MRVLKTIFLSAILAAAAACGQQHVNTTPPAPITSSTDPRWPLTGPAPAAFDGLITVRAPDGSAPAAMTGTFRLDDPAWPGPYPCDVKDFGGGSIRLACHLPIGLPLSNGGPIHIDAPDLAAFDGRANSSPEMCPCDPGLVNEVHLQALLPPAPTRQQLAGVNMTFQGLTVDTVTYGVQPWFSPMLPDLPMQGRENAYAAAHAAGDTHYDLLVSGCYHEGGQPYDQFPNIDFTKNWPGLRAQVLETIQHGFLAVLHLGGDGQSMPDGSYNDPGGCTYGYDVMMSYLPTVIQTLQQPIDLTPYVAFVPGYDGIIGYNEQTQQFGPWTLDQLNAFLVRFRQLLPTGVVGVEPSAGPLGGRLNDFLSPQAYDALDVVLLELGGQPYDDLTWQQADR
ncbi:MAG TPA: hypothetical protein VHZ73_02410, partial [Vicinamibacterales bacterium]|nr:hypothetical protein [Vicinamibacterales bacterium]